MLDGILDCSPNDKSASNKTMSVFDRFPKLITLGCQAVSRFDNMRTPSSKGFYDSG